MELSAFARDMIVSGFTLKDVEEAHCRGSALDHTHCITCVSRTCKVSSNDETSCDVVDCPRGCPQRYHRCKENEHVLVCLEERVACINSMYGCPVVLHRRKLVEHLRTCPASIVHCRAEWNRVHLEPARWGEQQSVLLRKTYADCGQLDTALAMRDHRVLVDRFLFPSETSTHSPGLLLQLQPTASMAAPVSSSSSDLDIPPAVLPDQWGCDIRQRKKRTAMLESSSPLPDFSAQPATSLSSSLGCVSDDPDFMETKTGVSSERSAEKGAGQERGAPHGQALRNVLSLSMSVECMARCQPKPANTYSFLCAQNVRRDEFAHHSYAVHDRISSDLNGWMEQRCPLAYLGCPFSFRRFRPSLPNMTICHSWLLESFGVTSVSPAGDFSHQTPSCLLPAFPETADSQEAATECGDQRHSSLTLSQTTAHSQTDADVRLSSALSENHSLKGALPEERHTAASSTSLLNAQLSENEADTSHKDPFSNISSSGCLQHPNPVDDEFSTLLNSTSLEEEGTCHTLNSQREQNQMNSSHLLNASGQGTEDLNPEGCQISAEDGDHAFVPSQDGSQLSSIVTPAQHQVPAVPNGPSRTAKPLSFSTSPILPSVGDRAVIYTGISANSCIRVDASSTLPDQDRNMAASSTLELADLPSEILRHMTRFLDSFSLYNLSLVSRSMRDLCCTVLQERGMVSLVWAKQCLADKVVWRVVGKSWSFSASFDPVESWCFTGHNPIPSHLQSCPYNQDRVERRDKFSIVPIPSETPLNTQIRDMLQDLLQQRRDFRGWIIRSNFDREYVSYARPMEGPFADVLTALGGTLPQ